MTAIFFFGTGMLLRHLVHLQGIVAMMSKLSNRVKKNIKAVDHSDHLGEWDIGGLRISQRFELCTINRTDF